MVVGVTLVIEASANGRVARASLIEKFCRVPPPSGRNRRASTLDRRDTVPLKG